MRKLVLCLFAIIFLFSVGCSNKNKSNITEISFSTWGSKSEISTIKSLIDSFEHENPNIKVNLIHIPDNYFQKLHLLIASNLSPDVMFVNNLNTQIYINSGEFEPLNDYINKSKIIKKSDFFEASFSPLTVGENVYAIPRDISNLVVYYNKDIFDRYNIAYPKDTWTIDEFLKTAQRLTIDTNNDNKVDIFGFGFEKNSLFWLPFLWSNGGGILSPEKEVIIGTSNSKLALQFYSDLRNKYHVAPKVFEQSSLTTSQLFLQNKVAMHLCGKWCSLTYNKNADFHWDIAQFPSGKNGSRVGLDVSAWAISSSSQHKEEAWKFIEFMASKNAIEQITKDGLILPANKNVAYSPIFLNSKPNNSKAFINAINNSIPTPVCSKYSEINDIINEKLESLFNGNDTADNLIDDGFVLELKKVVTD